MTAERFSATCPVEIGMYMRDSMRHWLRTLPRLDVIGMKKP